MKFTSLNISQFSSASEGKVDFASFLELMHQHAQKEKCQQEIVAAFQVPFRLFLCVHIQCQSFNRLMIELDQEQFQHLSYTTSFASLGRN
jgi:hypothetical protein